MKKFYKNNLLFNAAFVLVAVIVGYFANSNAMLADALFCLCVMSYSIANKRAHKAYSVVITLVSVFMCYYTFLTISGSVFIALDEAPQLWALPFLSVILIAKIFLVISAPDTDADENDKKTSKSYLKLLKFSAVVTGAAIVGLFASYLTDFYIEGAVAFGISFIALANAGSCMIKAFRKPDKINKDNTDEENNNDKNNTAGTESD